MSTVDPTPAGVPTSEPAYRDFEQRVVRGRVVAIVRAATADAARCQAELLIDAGAQVVEVSLTTPDAWTVVSELVRDTRPATALIGVGTVLSADQVRRAADIGAAFVLSPVFAPDFVRTAVERGVACVPGCATPSEMYQATELGAAFAKLFPASRWTPGSLRDVLQALPALRCVPTGGVRVDDAAAWFAAGAVAVGLGTALGHGTVEEVASRLDMLRLPY